ncbi:MAG: LysE family translocator [Pseudomonadota bacterium]
MIETLFAFETTTLVAFMGACFVLYLTPGADMMFTIASGAAGGPRAGVAAAAGISMGVLTHVALTAAGLGALILAYPAAYDAVRYIGAIYLLYLAWKMWKAEPEASEVKGAARMRRAFTRGYVTNILNPKVALFVLAFLPQFTDPAIGPVWQQTLWLGVILGAGGIVTDGSIGALAGVFSAWLRRSQRTLNRLAALVFGGLAARIVVN